jgi:hypothetical protein
MEAALKEKLETVVGLVDNMMADPDLDVEYCIPEVETTTDSCDVKADPYFVITYKVTEQTQPTRKFHLSEKYLVMSAQEMANLITFAIEQFKSGIDTVEYAGE